MKIHNRYSYGQLFCYSGIDGKTSFKKDLVGMFMEEPITIRFHFNTTVTLRIELGVDTHFKAVTGDMLDWDEYFVAFADKDTIVGKTPVLPAVITEAVSERIKNGNVERITTEFGGDFYLATQKENGGYKFSFTYGKVGNIWSDSGLAELREQRYAYFENKPECKYKTYERLYYKCLSVNKENVWSAEGKIPCRWTTPDRIPHRFMWLWDSVFHALAFAEYNTEMAKEAILAVLYMQREDGFISHMMSPDGQISEITQPQVLSWGVWNIYQKDKDIEFLRVCAPHLVNFLRWTMKNRDKNDNGLLEWYTEPENADCKCGESGLDNSPRFDFDLDLDAIDFSTYLCNDARYLSMIYKELGDEANEKYFGAVHERVKDKINSLLWDEEDGLYYDRLFDGKLTRVASSSSFLPMFAGICSKAQADKMVKVLTDENKFWTALPVPSMPKDSKYYDKDMWRGCSWLNVNYFIILGLKRYGYEDIAGQLREKTLNAVNKWYEQTGNIFEFYDADDKAIPFSLKRKGAQPEKPDYRKHIHSITDYNWSACFTLLLLFM